MLEGHGFSTKCFGTSLFNCQTDWSGHGPAWKFWLLERALTLHIRCAPLRWFWSGSVIWDHSDHGRSNELMNPLWTRIHWFIWSTMIQVISEHWYWWGISQRNGPKDKHNSFTCNLFFTRKWYITWPFISIFLQKNLLEQILKLGSSVPNIISKSVKDQFELCLVKCRTSSKVTKLIYIYKLHDYLHCIYM